MPALVAGIHDLCQRYKKDVDGRNKSGHDDVRGIDEISLRPRIESRKIGDIVVPAQKRFTS
ncbi:MAG: hypothetical protein WBD53_05465 [Xanthobacteraceae bacterium]